MRMRQFHRKNLNKKKNQKAQSPTNSILNNEIEKKSIVRKYLKKKDQSQLGLTFQTRDPSHEVKIIP